MIYDARKLKIIMDYNNFYYSNIIYRCNNKCPHCISHNTNKRRLNEGVYDILKDIFPITGNYDNDIFIINGGEPTLSEDFIPILDFLIERKIKIVVYSNGRLLRNKNIEKYKRDPKIRFIVPLYGKEEIHNQYTGTLSYKETMESIYSFNKSDGLDIKFLISADTKIEDLKELYTEVYPHCNFINISAILCKGNYEIRKSQANIISEFIEYLISNNQPLKISNFPICGFSQNLRNYLNNGVCKEQKIANYYFISSKEIFKIKYDQMHRWEKSCSNCCWKSLCVDNGIKYRVMTISNGNIFLGEE